MNDDLLKIILGNGNIRDLPDKLDLTPLRHQFLALCEDCYQVAKFPVDPARLPNPRLLVEHGSCMVWANNEVMIMPHRTRGTASIINPRHDCHSPKEHCPPGYIGFAHTHVHDEDRVPHPAGFSDTDFNATVADEDKLALVTNGMEIFALVRLETSPVPGRMNWTEFKQLSLSEKPENRQKLWEIWGEGRKFLACVPIKPVISPDPAARQSLHPIDWTRMLLALNFEACELLRFAFYRGEFDDFQLKLEYRPGDGS